MGAARPAQCKHGNRYLSEAELKPKERTPLRAVSEKRQAQIDAGERPRTGSTLKRTNGFAASQAQRDKVRGLVCVGCGREAGGGWAIDPMHVWPRGKGGCDSPDCVLPGCRHEATGDGCHRAFDQGELSLLERLAESEAWAVEQAHPILKHGVGLVELVRRLSGNGYEFVTKAELGELRARIVELEAGLGSVA